MLEEVLELCGSGGLFVGRDEQWSSAHIESEHTREKMQLFYQPQNFVAAVAFRCGLLQDMVVH